MNASNQSGNGSPLAREAAKLGEVVLSTKWVEIARPYLRFVSELGQGIYRTKDNGDKTQLINRATLIIALDSVVEDLEKNAPPSHNKIADYDFLREIAKMYGLEHKVTLYDSRIAELNKSLDYIRG